MASRTGRLFAALMCLGEVACASYLPRPGEVASEEDADRDRVLLTVENQHFNDATIYARWNGERRQVGIVIGKSRETFELEWRSHRFVLEVDFVAGGHYRSNPIDVERGDHLKFIIGPS